MKWSNISMILVLFLVGMSCENSEDRLTDKIKIGFSVASDDFLLERWNKDVKIFTSRLADLGAEVILAKSPGDALSQIPQIQYLLDENVDVLVVIPQDMELLNGIIRKAIDQGIPVLSYDRPIMGMDISGYISFDNQQVGELLAQALLDQVPQGEYLVVNGSVRDNNSFEINKGMSEILFPAEERGDITIVDQIWLDLWSFDEALLRIEESLNTHPEIDAIFCSNDAIAGAAVQLLAQRRLAGTVKVVGQDADLLACQRIVQGTQLMTAYKPIIKLATRAAEVAMMLAKDEPLEYEHQFDNGSSALVPFFREEPIGVFSHNMDDTVIRDGFHSHEDVYRE